MNPAENLTIVEALQTQDGIELVPPDSSFCSGYIFPLTIAEISGTIVEPAAEVKVHGKNIIDIISHLGLKYVLGLADGDWITVTIGCAAV